MIDTALVKQSVALMGGFSDSETERYSSLISAAVLSAADSIKEDVNENDPRVIQYAAGLAYKAICCSADSSDNITSFTAGDVSFKQEFNLQESAENCLSFAAENVRKLMKPEAQADLNNCFAFLGV